MNESTTDKLAGTTGVIDRQPAISVIMPVYNRAGFVGQAVESVLAQSFPDFELIVVDDGSTDESVAVVRRSAGDDPRVRLICQENSGKPGIARNRGLQEARGRFLTFLDSDDVYAPRRLEKCLDVMLGYPNIVLLFHDMYLMNEDGWRKPERYLIRAGFDAVLPLYGTRVNDFYLLSEQFFVFMSLHYAAVHTNSAFLRADIDLEGGAVRFPEDLSNAEDIDLWFRYALAGDVAYVDELLSGYREHEGGISRQKEQFLRDAIKSHLRNLRRGHARFDKQDIAAYRRKLSKHYRELSYIQLNEGRNRDASNAAWHAFRLEPRLDTFTNLLKTFLPWREVRGLVRRIGSTSR